MEIDWPPLPKVTKDDQRAALKLALYQAQLDVIKAERQAALAVEKAELDAKIESDKRESTANIEREKSDWANEYTQAQAVNSAYLEVAKGAIERATAKASFVQAAATAISGAYTGILGLSFAVAQSRYLPFYGVAPTLFLGLAIFLAAVYVSFVTRPEDVPVLSSDGTLRDTQRQRRNSFVLWTRTTILHRRHFLQASVISLGIGALLLPLPFLSVSGLLATILVAVGLLFVLILPLIIERELTVRSFFSWFRKFQSV